MITSLLPGLRDLRTPLAVGYVWLVLIWIWFGSLLPTRNDGRGADAALFELARLAGRPGLTAAITFVAYLLGATTQLNPGRGLGSKLARGGPSSTEKYASWLAGAVKSLARELSERTLRLLRIKLPRTLVTPQQAPPWHYLSHEATRLLTLSRYESLKRRVQMRVHKARQDLNEDEFKPAFRTAMARSTRLRFRASQATAKAERRPGYPEGLIDALVITALEEILRDLPEEVTRLQLQNQALFDRHDRFVSESELRLSLMPPVAALTVTLSLSWSLIFLVGAVAVLVLHQQAVVSARHAFDVVAEAISAGALTPSGLEEAMPPRKLGSNHPD